MDHSGLKECHFRKDYDFLSLADFTTLQRYLVKTDAESVIGVRSNTLDECCQSVPQNTPRSCIPTSEMFGNFRERHFKSYAQRRREGRSNCNTAWGSGALSQC